MPHKWILAPVAVFAFAGAFLVTADPITASSTLPCVPDIGSGPSKAPAAPKGLRIIKSTAQSILREFVEVLEARGVHPLFDILASRTDCHVAYTLRSGAELDSLSTAAVSAKKRPIVYDPAMDAARISIYPPDSADSQQKIVPLKIDNGSVLITWDFRFDENFRWRGDGYIARHKTWRIDPGPWIALKTDYQQGATKGGGALAELLINIPSGQFIAPGSSRDGETLLPRRAQFFFNENSWVRVWMFMEDLGEPVARLSIWVADEHREPVQLYDRNPLFHPAIGMTSFRIEYDTSADSKPNPSKEMHSWNRNMVVLRNVSRADLGGILKRP